ncbi:polysaccharide biosynthesis/export family protein [Singulisphaera rosea]
MVPLPSISIIEAPDLITVDVVEALPGRPITGDRLVQPNGKINLGYYGEVSVQGLTVTEAKVRIIDHLKAHLSDEALGLTVYRNPTTAPAPHSPDTPDAIEEPKKPTKPTAFSNSPRRGMRARVSAKKPMRFASQEADPEPEIINTPSGKVVNIPPPGPGATVAPRFVPELVREQVQAKAEPIEVPAGESVKVTIDVNVNDKEKGNENEPGVVISRPGMLLQPGQVYVEEEEVQAEPVAPADSANVSVQIVAYNSKGYYVQGDVAQPGRMPCTGRETVLDALNYAGGLFSTADPKSIRLVRPARPGRPAKVLPVDYKAILEEGQTATNYQIFPGDRLFVGRNEVVQKTIEIDRLAAASQTVVNSMLQYAFMVSSLKGLSDLTPGAPPLTNQQREKLIKDWTELWWKAASTPDGVKMDEASFRELLIRQLNPPATVEKK